MITISIDPIIVTLGPFVLAWHGLLTALGVIVAVLVTVQVAKGAGIPEDDVYSTAIWAIPGGVIGARLVHVIDQWPYYSINPAAIFGFQGLALYGGLLGGALTGVAYARLKGIPVGRLADAAAPAMILAQIIGRIGCVINGDAYGAPTSLPWGFVYTHPGAFAVLNVPGHPTPVYEILWDLMVFAVLWRYRRWGQREGALFLLYLSFYSLGRFFITFLRQDVVVAFGLQQAHIIALLVLVIAVPLLLRLLRQGTRERLDETIESVVQEEEGGGEEG